MFSLQRQLFAQNEERLLAVVHVKSVKKTVKKRVLPPLPFPPPPVGLDAQRAPLFIFLVGVAMLSVSFNGMGWWIPVWLTLSNRHERWLVHRPPPPKAIFPISLSRTSARSPSCKSVQSSAVHPRRQRRGGMVA